MSSEDSKILEFTQYQQSDKKQFIIYASLGSLIEKIGECKINPEISSTTKVGKHVLAGFSISAISSLKILNVSMMYTKVQSELKLIYKSLREYEIKIISFKKKKWSY